MPTVSIEMFPGRTWEQKSDLVARVTEAVCSSLGVTPELVKVKLYEIPAHHSAVGGKLLGAPPGAPSP